MRLPRRFLVHTVTVRAFSDFPDFSDDRFAGLTGFFHHIHSGAEFGKAGEAISFFSGLALLFFALSGIWMYVRMWRERARRGASGCWFWR